MSTDRDASIERLLRHESRAAERSRHDCLDAETLAAFSDDALTGAEHLAIEAHLADCQRCQAIAADMIRSAAQPIVAEPDVRPWWARRRVLNWLVPATAAATAVALWVAVPGQRTVLPDRAQVSEGTAAAPPPAASIPPAAELAETQAAAEPSSQPAATPERFDRLADADANEPAGSLPGSTDSAPPDAAQKVGAGDEFRARQEDAASALGAGAAAAVSQPSPAPATRAASAAIAATFEVISSDPQHRWRVGSNALVEHSDDGGTTWTTQETGTPGPLTAGSSPSPLVCWLAGRGGIVLRSADSGRTWQRTAFPETANVVAVRAQDASSATVTLADGRRLGTTDGGVTWIPVQD